MTKTAYFLLKTDISNDYELADAAKDIETEAKAVCVDYMWLNDAETKPYISWDFPLY